MDWQYIEDNLSNLVAVDGGFTKAKRGLLDVPEIGKVFIKVGTDTLTSAWANKEIGVYEALINYGFKYIPKLVACNNAKTGFALEYLGPGAGWEWETKWTEDRLAATLDALDRLANVPVDIFPPGLLMADEADTNENPWLLKRVSEKANTTLIDRLNEYGHADIVKNLDHLTKDFSFKPTLDTLVHYDVRRDNCAWNPNLKTVRLIDWNWLHIGSRDIDLCGLLVNAYKSGIAVEGFKDRLNHETLLWLSGYWLGSSVDQDDALISDPVSLRSFQFDSGIAAYELASSLI